MASIPLMNKKDASLDFLSLGALVVRLDPGVIPFEYAQNLDLHVSGGEYNVAANLSRASGKELPLPVQWWTTQSGKRLRARSGEWAYKRFTSALPMMGGSEAPPIWPMYTVTEDKDFVHLWSSIIAATRQHHSLPRTASTGMQSLQTRSDGSIAEASSVHSPCHTFPDHPCNEKSKGAGSHHLLRSKLS